MSNKALAICFLRIILIRKLGLYKTLIFSIFFPAVLARRIEDSVMFLQGQGANEKIRNKMGKTAGQLATELGLNIQDM